MPRSENEMTWRGGRSTPLAPFPAGVSAPLDLAPVLAAAYLAATALGVLMRFVLAGVPSAVPFDHLLHAHSHTLFFGWAGLGVMVAATRVTGGSAGLLWTMRGLALSLPVLLIGFLAVGYHPLTIAISTLVMLGWYVAVAQWWTGAQALTGVGLTALRAGFAYLVVASLGVWTLAVLQASGRTTPLAESLAVHAFVNGFEWFLVLGVVGLLVLRSGPLGLDLDRVVVARALRMWIPLAWLTFPLAVPGGPEVPVLGPLARLAGVALLIPSWIWARCLWRAARAGFEGAALRWSVIWFITSSLATAGAAIGGSGILSAVGRNGVVIALHALLVGFVTTALVLVLTRRAPICALRLHHLSLLAMILALTPSLGSNPGLLMWAAAAAALVLWCAGIW